MGQILLALGVLVLLAVPGLVRAWRRVDDILAEPAVSAEPDAELLEPVPSGT
ncbi:hypothetical protein [Actinoplanes sp. NPDC051859]|uniref:hypothetical protein n=1 Tax=Actinoplanes sp. NPDC051859 TaxID=3363909 RepID=UPI0037BB4FF3